MQGQRFLLKSPVEQLRWSIGQRDPVDPSAQLQRAHLLKWSPRCPWADCSCVFACAEGCRCHNSAHLLKGWWVACRSMKRSGWGLGAAERQRNLWLPEPRHTAPSWGSCSPEPLPASLVITDASLECTRIPYNESKLDPSSSATTRAKPPVWQMSRTIHSNTQSVLAVCTLLPRRSS